MYKVFFALNFQHRIYLWKELCWYIMNIDQLWARNWQMYRKIDQGCNDTRMPNTIMYILHIKKITLQKPLTFLHKGLVTSNSMFDFFSFFGQKILQFLNSRYNQVFTFCLDNSLNVWYYFLLPVYHILYRQPFGLGHNPCLFFVILLCLHPIFGTELDLFRKKSNSIVVQYVPQDDLQ